MKLKNILNEIKKTDFKSWFGNSKVVDSAGKPLVVYHGSRNKIGKFHDGMTFFTDDYYNADGYAGGEYVYDVYLSIQKPLIIDAEDKKWNELDLPDGMSTVDIASKVDKSKYDGVIFYNIKDSWIDDEDYQDAGTIYVVFTSKQIRRYKSNDQ